MLNPGNDPILPKRPLRVAWFTYFPIEWLPELPPELQKLPRLHPATWQRVLWEEFRHDESLELHIIILRSHFPATIRFRRNNTTFHCIKTPGGTRATTLFWTDTFYVSRELKQIQPDLVHAWGSEFGGAAIASRLNWPALVTMQGILTWYGSVFPLNLHTKLARLAEPPSLRKAHVVTCESSFGMNYLAERYPHLKLLQVEHAPHPSFSQVVRRPQNDPLRIVCVGTFLFWKGADVVIQALARLETNKPFELFWIGAKDAALEADLRSKTPEALWKRITFKHNLSPAEIAAELSQATLFLHAARADNSPNSVKEAVVAGVPVIATNTGGIPDYVIPGKNGFLFASGNVDDCASKLQDAIAHPTFNKGLVDPATLSEMRAYLSASTMATKFKEAYSAVLKDDPRSTHSLRASNANSTT